MARRSPTRARLLLSLLILFLPILAGATPPSPLAPRPSPLATHRSPETLDLLLATPLPVRDPLALAARVHGITPARTVGAGVAEPLPVGRVDDFWVLDQVDTSYKRRTAELRLVTANAYWYVERGQSVARTDLERSANHFEQVTYPTVRRYFGSEWSPGIDADPRITIFVGTVPGVGAYFSNWDAYPQAVFRYSNEREMVHLNAGSLRPGTPSFDATLAHEFQHMVHWNMNPASETWVDEGSAELASSLAVSGRPIGATQFQRQPDLQLTAWSPVGGTGPHYQAAFLFMQYFAQRFGPEGLRDLIAEQGRPTETFDRYLARAGHGIGFDDLFLDWVVANLLDEPSLEDGRYGHERSDPRAAVLGRVDFGGTALADTVHQHGADYIELRGDGGDAELIFEGDPGVPLVRADPTSGQKLWWSNRGDGLDTSMTRYLDLRDASGPLTLRFNLWYETERAYDFFYVMASSDGGTSWQVLQGALASDANPTGNAVGPGHSGTSGAGSAPAWVTETVDLSPFAGGEVLIRFEYVTDQAYNARGVLLDDVEIPELGYRDDAEEDSGWVYDGFLRSDNAIPQRWGLRLVEFHRGGRIVVRPLAVGPDRTLVEGLPGLGGELERAILTVSGLAPRTLEKAGYRVTLRRPA